MKEGIIEDIAEVLLELGFDISDSDNVIKDMASILLELEFVDGGF